MKFNQLPDSPFLEIQPVPPPDADLGGEVRKVFGGVTFLEWIVLGIAALAVFAAVILIGIPADRQADYDFAHRVATQSR